MKIAFAIEKINKRNTKKNAKKRGELHKGGVQKVLAELANELSERGHGITIFCTDINSRDEFMYSILPKVQYCNLLEEVPIHFIDRAKIKFAKNFMEWKWKFYNTIKRLMQSLLQFPEKTTITLTDHTINPADNKKPSRLTKYISKWNGKLDEILNEILNNHILNYSRLIKQNAPDVFILFGESNFFLHILSRAFTEKDFPIIYSVHRSLRVYFDRISRRSDPYALPRFNKVLELVDAILVLLPEYINDLPKPLQNKAFSIPNPIEQVDKHKRANPELDTGIKTILAVGRLETNKNHAALLEAFASLSPRHPDWQVRIFGDGKLKEQLTDQIQKLKLTDRVFLMGVKDTIHEEYQKAHILAMPSEYEGFPLALGEAMAHGLPAVGFDTTSGVNFLIQHEHNGLLADGNNSVDGLTLCLEELMSNPELRAELGKNGVETMKLYNPEKIYDLWEETILDVKHNFNKI